MPGRRSLRRRHHDYRWPATYFITACTYQRAPIFGNVINGRMVTTGLGAIAEEEWFRTETVRDHVLLDAFIVMPDHIHGIMRIERQQKTPKITLPTKRTFGGSLPGSLSTIMRQYKSMVTKRINRLRGTPGEPVWQRNFWERPFSSDQELDNIRIYILANPKRWDQKHRAQQ